MRVFILLALFLLSSLAVAAENKVSSDAPFSLGDFGTWKAYYFIDQDTGGKVCFMSSSPEKEEGAYNKNNRGKVLFFVTHWAGEKTSNVVSVSAGYPYKEGSEATVSIDGRDFTLATVNETAWVRDSSTDDTVTAALRKGSTLIIKGVSKRGTATTDTYNLKGSAQAYTAITKACGT